MGAWPLGSNPNAWACMLAAAQGGRHIFACTCTGLRHACVPHHGMQFPANALVHRPTLLKYIMDEKIKV